MLIWDKGSANSSHGVAQLLKALEVETVSHRAGAPWVKGGVECANNIVETQFESRLKFEPVDNVDTLNAAVARWAKDYNANAIAHVDSRIRRGSGEPMVRDDLWQHILATPEALIELPPREVCQWFMAGKTHSRIVNQRCISFVHPQIGQSRRYDLSAWAEFIGEGMQVGVSPLLFRDGAVRIEIERPGDEPLLIEVSPEVAFDDYGRPMSATLWGEENRTAPHTLDQNNQKRMVRAAYGEGVNLHEADKLRARQQRPFEHFNDGKGLVTHSHLGSGDSVDRLLPKARSLDSATLNTARSATCLPPLSLVEAARRLRAQLGEAWNSEHYQWLAQRYPQGAPQDKIDAIADEIRQGNSLTALKLVNGETQ